jgi:hypothetical protein
VLALSDLLLAEQITPAVDEPRARTELRIAPKRTTTLQAGEPLHVYFEVYGLGADADGYATIQAELRVETAGATPAVARVFRGAQELFTGGGRDPDPTVRWQRVTRVDGDAAIDYLRIEVPELRPGEYRLRLKISDPATGRSGESERLFTIR